MITERMTIADYTPIATHCTPIHAHAQGSRGSNGAVRVVDENKLQMSMPREFKGLAKW